MSESNRYPSIRAVREVTPSDQLEDFLSAVQAVSIQTIESPRTVLVHDTLGRTKARHIDPVKVSQVDDLSYVHFERRALNADVSGRDYVRTAERMTKDRWPNPGKRRSLQPELNHYPNPLKLFMALAMARINLDVEDEIKVTASNFKVIDQSRSALRSSEYMLILDDSPEKETLNEISEAVCDVLRRFAIGRKIVGFNNQPDELGVPFARMRPTVSEAEIELWEQGVADNMPEQGLTLRLQQLKWGFEGLSV